MDHYADPPDCSKANSPRSAPKISQAETRGGDHVVQWLEHFAQEHGLSPSDLRIFDQLAKPNWLEAAIP